MTPRRHYGFRPMRRPLPTLFLIISLLAGSTVSAFDNTDDWLVVERGIVRLLCHAEDRTVGERTAAAMHSSFPALAEVLGYYGNHRVDVLMAGSQREFDRLTGGGLPHWGEAATDYVRRVIILKSPRFSRASLRELEITAAHELTHHLLGYVTTPGRLPRWLNEGLAVLYSNEHGYRSHLVLAKALHSRSLIPLSDVADVLSFERDKANVAYAECGSATAYFLEREGEEGLRAIFSALNVNDSFDKAFTEVIGYDPIDFEIAWRENLRSRYRWYFLLDVDTYIWLLLPALAAVAFVAVRFRNRRIMRRWETEEKLTRDGTETWDDPDEKLA